MSEKLLETTERKIEEKDEDDWSGLKSIRKVKKKGRKYQHQVSSFHCR